MPKAEKKNDLGLETVFSLRFLCDSNELIRFVRRFKEKHVQEILPCLSLSNFSPGDQSLGLNFFCSPRQAI
jgi:hypothetical protein